MRSLVSAYVVSGSADDESLAKQFKRVERRVDSSWALCDFKPDERNGCLDPQARLTTELSKRFGDVLFFFADQMGNQLSFEHSRDGELLRKLIWLTDGCTSSWGLSTGDHPEPWEESILFSEAGKVRSIEKISIGFEEGEIDEREYDSLKEELEQAWANRSVVIGKPLPLTDASIILAIARFYGFDIPDK